MKTGLQIYLLSSSSGKTAVSFHQEKLDDLYMREVMKKHWEEIINRINQALHIAK